MRSPACREARRAPLFRTSDRREQLPRGERRPLSSEVGHGPSHPIAIGHDFPDVENVVEENERYAVVQKRGVAAEEAARLDPRSPA
jgi:hypothetical protein